MFSAALWTELLSPVGRLNRQRFIIYHFSMYGACIVGVILFALIKVMPLSEGTMLDDLVIGLLVLLFVWSNVAWTIKRLHDLNLSGWWLPVLYAILVGAGMIAREVEGPISEIVPRLAQFAYYIWMFCAKGTDGPNRFGADRLSKCATLDSALPAVFD